LADAHVKELLARLTQAELKKFDFFPLKHLGHLCFNITSFHLSLLILAFSP